MSVEATPSDEVQRIVARAEEERLRWREQLLAGLLRATGVIEGFLSATAFYIGSPFSWVLGAWAALLLWLSWSRKGSFESRVGLLLSSLISSGAMLLSAYGSAPVPYVIFATAIVLATVLKDRRWGFATLAVVIAILVALATLHGRGLLPRYTDWAARIDIAVPSIAARFVLLFSALGVALVLAPALVIERSARLAMEMTRSQLDLAVSKRRLTEVLDGSTDGCFDADFANGVVYVNPRWNELAGREQDRSSYRMDEWDAMTHPEDVAPNASAMKAVTEGRADRLDVTHRLRGPGGWSRWVRTRAKVVERDAAGMPKRVAGTTSDIHEQRAAQQQLQVASRLAALGTLVTGIGHEVNSPLAGALGGEIFAVETLREIRERMLRGEQVGGGELVAELDEVLEGLADTGLKRVSEIVKDLMAFGRSDQRKTRIRLVDAVEQAMRWLRTSTSSTAAIRVEDRGAPDVKAALGQMTQVLVNLVGNAAKSMPEGRRGVVTVRVGPGSDGKALLEVEDDGAGMTPEVMNKIFDPFFTTRAAGQGTGLGLAVTHAIVTDHGGTITVESEVGKGSTFRVELPAAPAET